MQVFFSRNERKSEAEKYFKPYFT